MPSAQPATALIAASHLLLRGALPPPALSQAGQAFVAAHGEAGFAGLLGSLTSSLSNEALAALVVGNAGLGGRSDLVGAVTGLYAAFGAQGRGAVTIALIDKLLGMTGDPVYGSDARAFAGSVATGAAQPSDALAAKAAALSVLHAAFDASAAARSPYVTALDSNLHWNGSALTFSFNESLPTEYTTAPFASQYSAGWQPLTTDERAAVRAVVGELNTLLGVRITEVASGGDIRFNAVDTSGAGSLSDAAGFANYPGPQDIAGDVFLATGLRAPGYYDAGQYGRLVIAHETGHALGLKHSFDGSAKLPAALEDRTHTVMSYTDGPSQVLVFSYADDVVMAEYEPISRPGYSVLDVAALQAIYGTNGTTRTGNDTYTLAFNQRTYLTIWDAGGTDVIDAHAATGDSRIDLRPGSFSSVDVHSAARQQADAVAYYIGIGQEWATSFVGDVFADPGLAQALYTGQDNLGIAYGVWIENVTTGTGNDTVWDNAVDNHISTGAGDDVIHLGAGGFDRIDGETGFDMVVFDVAQSAVRRAWQDDGSWLVVGHDFSAEIVGVERFQFTDGLIAAA